MSSLEESKLVQTLRGNQQEIPPVWFMRQAGRYLPEYREVRERAGTFLDLCFAPELASEVTLQPVRRFDLDAAILFADILVIPFAFGQDLRFVENEGPVLDPIVAPSDIDGFAKCNVNDRLAPIFETIRISRTVLDDSKALIGFAGAPWTVATYMLNGGSARDPSALREKFYQDRPFILALIDLLTEKTIDYLLAQIDAGADIIQLFDSWAGGLPGPVLETVSIRPVAKIASAIKRKRP